MSLSLARALKPLEDYAAGLGELLQDTAPFIACGAYIGKVSRYPLGRSGFVEEGRVLSNLCRASRGDVLLWEPLVHGQFGRQKRTYLMSAARVNDVERLSWLLERGAPLEVQDAWGRDALGWAAAGGARGATQVLIQRGAVRVHAALEACVDNDKLGPLDALLSQSTSALGCTAAATLSPLLHRASSGAMVRGLLNRGAIVDNLDIKGHTPFVSIFQNWRGAQSEFVGVIKGLLGAGASLFGAPDGQTINGLTPLALVFRVSENLRESRCSFTPRISRILLNALEKGGKSWHSYNRGREIVRAVLRNQRLDGPSALPSIELFVALCSKCTPKDITALDYSTLLEAFKSLELPSSSYSPCTCSDCATCKSLDFFHAPLIKLAGLLAPMTLSSLELSENGPTKLACVELMCGLIRLHPLVPKVVFLPQ